MLFLLLLLLNSNSQLSGRLTNEYLDTINIARTPDAKDRDQLVLSQRDVELLTHPHSVAYMRDYLDRLASGQDPEREQIEAAKKAIEAQKKQELILCTKVFTNTVIPTCQLSFLHSVILSLDFDHHTDFFYIILGA